MRDSSREHVDDAVEDVGPTEVGLEGIFLADVSGSPSGASLDMDRGVALIP